MTSRFFNLARIEQQLPRVHLRWLPEVDSTNNLALREADSVSPPTLFLTDRQTAGRGRGANQWHSSDGSLAFSLLLDPLALQLPLERWPTASLAVGLAACEAVEFELPDEQDEQDALDLTRQAVSARATKPLVKWPNDVYLRNRKLAGILIETTVSPPRMVIGVGVNVNNRFESAPADVRARSISLAETRGSEVELTDLLIRLVALTLSRVAEFANAPPTWRDAWRQRCFLTGRHIEVLAHGQSLSGVCQGVDDSGALLLQAATGAMTRVLAGEIVRYD